MVNVFERIKEFIIKRRWDYDFPLVRELSLQKDLKIYGDDAVDFFLDFSKEFNVDISDFKIEDYFEGEGDSTFDSIVKFLKREKNKNLKEFTIRDLENAVIAGKIS